MQTAPSERPGAAPARGVLLTHESSLAHQTGSHPEQPARMTAIERALARQPPVAFERVQSRAVELETLMAVHPERHIERVRRACASATPLDPDTVVSEGSFEAALHACGGAVQLVDLLLERGAATGFSIHRPPGHHAEPERAMGFCLFNNVAVAVRHALSEHGLERVLVVDWDVHHGNGTNEIFAADPSVLFCSIHQWPLYPGTGAADDAGRGPGEGFTVNLPVPPGSADAVFCSLIEHVIVPLARCYEPQLVMISAGFDAHADDPLANCRVSEEGFAAMTSSLAGAAARLRAPVGAVLEGGYALEALGRCVAATVRELGRAAGVGGPDPDEGKRLQRSELAVCRESALALERLRRHWPQIA
ncbi:MAG TPA: histone deacetylase [Solirubrobacteraceae bacterium]|nr:histone deacetylase [Solirubrobacteraceae bacterium]